MEEVISRLFAGAPPANKNLFARAPPANKTLDTRAPLIKNKLRTREKSAPLMSHKENITRGNLKHFKSLLNYAHITKNKDNLKHKDVLKHEEDFRNKDYLYD